jgi:hypothetical protein
MIMHKISGLGHVSISMDGINLDGRRDLQKRKIVKESTGGGPVAKSPMLKSDYCV